MESSENEQFISDDLIFSRHPNPAWARQGWISLDGPWDLEHRGQKAVIQVPFPIGSPASGVDFPDSGRFVYSRVVTLPPGAEERRWVLHVGACDYEAEVFFNGKAVGSHRGGYSSFALVLEGAKTGSNSLEVRVRDSHSPRQVRGKQTFLRKPFYVWYGGIAGIWQHVWLEDTGPAYLESAKVTVDFEAREVRVEAQASASPSLGDLGLDLVVRSPGGRCLVLKAQRLPPAEPGQGPVLQARFSFEEAGVEAWSPESPNLYSLEYRLCRGPERLDTVHSYFGARKVAARDGRLELNGKDLFLRMVLVQGYYPQGVYTPSSGREMARDIGLMKEMGYNGARIHQKLESPYFQYLCDRLGLLTTLEMPSFYLGGAKALRAYETELREIIARDSSHPSSILWILFNETWGVWSLYGKGSRTRAFVRSMVALVRSLDPGRLVIENSGWEHFDTDIVDFHHYLGTAALAREAYARLAKDRVGQAFSLAKVLAFYLKDQVATATRALFLEDPGQGRDRPWLLSEYGGFGWYATAEEGQVIDKIEAYTKDAVDSGLFRGYCLTQLYDVGGETNGLLKADRSPKVDLGRLRAINAYRGNSKG